MKWTPGDVMLALKRRFEDFNEFRSTHPKRFRALATVTIVAVVVASFLGPFLFAGDDARHLSAYATGPEDLSTLRAEIEEVAEPRGGSVRALATSAYFVESVRDPADTVLFVVGVEKQYTQGEAEAILRFVEGGGTLVLANDVGYGNRLARAFGVLFSDKGILDAGTGTNYLGNPRFPIVEVPFDGSSYKVLMNAPARMIIIDPDRVNVLATSSSETYVDVDGDGEIDLKDNAQAYPLVAEVQHGDGRVVLIADTGLFMNDMLEVPGFDNLAFARALTQSTLSGATHVLIDESRHSPPPSAAAGDAGLRAVVIATSTPGWDVGLALAAVIGVVAAVVLTRDTEDWSVHAFDLGKDVPAPKNVGPTPERLQRLAQRAISENFNIPVDYLQSAPFEELVRLVRDRELVAVATGKDRAHPSKALYEKLVESAPTTTAIPQEA